MEKIGIKRKKKNAKSRRCKKDKNACKKKINF
jgi:hypothetical protein